MADGPNDPDDPAGRVGPARPGVARGRAGRIRAALGEPGTEGRRRFVALWALVAICYGGLRVLVVTLFLARYGVDPVVFACVELSSSIVYGVGSAHVVAALADRAHRALRRWVLVAASGFLAPDVYVVASGGSLPVGALVVVVGVATTTSVLTVRDIRRRAREAASSGSSAAGSIPARRGRPPGPPR